MSLLLRIAAITASLVMGCAIAAVAGQAPPPPANEDCMACHSDPAAARADGTLVAVDAAAFAGSKHAPLTCVSCHADLATLAEYPHAEKLQQVNCASCHEKIGATFDDSIHARARVRSGLNVAPTCANCHGKHDILGVADLKSRVVRGTVPATCGTCHDGIEQRFAISVHATALASNHPDAPVCSSCHTAHNIQRADNDQSRVRSAEGCGTCHAKVAEAFVRTFHGKVSQLGSGHAATCASCHNAHDILPATNAFSTIAPQNLQRTCSSCHAGASASFVQYDPHPDPDNYERSAVLWWANQFYWILIPGCFGFFGLHSLLWFWRARKDARAHQEQGR